MASQVVRTIGRVVAGDIALNSVSDCIWVIDQCNEDSGARTFHGYVRCSRTTLWLPAAACGLFAHPNYLNLVYRLGRRCCSTRTAQAQAWRLTRSMTKKSKSEIKPGATVRVKAQSGEIVEGRVVYLWEEKSVPMVRVASGELGYNIAARMLVDRSKSQPNIIAPKFP